LRPLRDARDGLAKTIDEIPARTHAGLAAKLRSFVAYDHGDTSGTIILASACRDAMAFPNTAALPAVSGQPPSSPDAELIALCDEFAARLEKIRDLCPNGAMEIPDNAMRS
jgi:hypothetical protein